MQLLQKLTEGKRVRQACCVGDCNNTNLNRSMYHLPKVTKTISKEEVINDSNLIR